MKLSDLKKLVLEVIEESNNRVDNSIFKDTNIDNWMINDEDQMIVHAPTNTMFEYAFLNFRNKTIGILSDITREQSLFLKDIFKQHGLTLNVGEEKTKPSTVNYDKWRRANNGKTVFIAKFPVDSNTLYISVVYNEESAADVLSWGKITYSGADMTKGETKGTPFSLNNLQTKTKNPDIYDIPELIFDDAEFNEIIDALVSKDGNRFLQDVIDRIWLDDLGSTLYGSIISWLKPSVVKLNPTFKPEYKVMSK